MNSIASSLSISSSKYDIDNMDDISSFSKLKKVRNVKYSKLLEDKMISRETKNKALQQKQKSKKPKHDAAPIAQHRCGHCETPQYSMSNKTATGEYIYHQNPWL